MSGLQHVGDEGPPRCAICGEQAAGPCIRCKQFVCGDCCVLSEGGVEVYAVCTRCDRKGGSDLAPRYASLVRFFGLIFAAIVAFVLLTMLLPR